MDRQFSPVSLKDKDKYIKYWNGTPCHSLDYTLTNLWGWQQFYGLEWSFEDEICWIRQTNPKEVYWAPMANWGQIDWTKTAFAGLEFSRVPEQLKDIWHEQLGDRMEAEEERGQWEYLYLQQDLAELAGNRFHKKRNHLNSYIKTYGQPDYRPITDQMVREVLDVQDDWCQWHECDDSPSLRAENTAINRVLTHWDYFGDLVGGSLYVDGKMVAFSVGEPLDAENLGVHFEKCLSGFKGIYQAMNCEFVKNAGAGYKWINRAQDMDEEGLRQAKMTYLPAAFLKKYHVMIKA